MYANLPSATNLATALDSMRQWELDHPDQCERYRDDGQFFGFTEVAQGYLGRFTHLINIPAVRDAASDATEGRGSAITELLDLVVRAALANSAELKELRTQTQSRYEELMNGASVKELAPLESGLPSTLRTYVPDAQVGLEWITEGGVEIALPKANVKLVEHGYSTAV